MNYQDQIKEKIKVFFQNKKWKETLVFCFFLALSAGFWLLQTLQGETEMSFNVSLKYANIPPKIAFNQELPPKIKVTLKDKGIVLLSYLFGKKIAPINIDLKDLDIKENRFVISDYFLAKELNKALIPTTILLAVTPPELNIQYDVLKEKKLPVIFNGFLLPASGFMLFDDVRFNPSEIEVYGPENILDTLTGIYTQRVEFENLNEPLKTEIKLKPIEGVKMELNGVELLANVEEFTEKNFNLPIIPVNAPQKLILRTFPATVIVTCLLPLSQYNELKGSDLEVTVNYQELDTINSSTIPVNITKKPTWLKNFRLNPDKVEYLLEQKNETP